jgi:hypothetical protein
MRIIDVACASSFAITAMLLLVAVNPGAMRLQAQEIGARSAAEDNIQSYLAHYDLSFLASSNFESICASATSFNNQSAHMSISVNGTPCAGIAPPAAVIDRAASTTLELNGRTVTIEAWIQ